MRYPEQYRTELLNALKSIDLHAVDDVVEIFRQARQQGRCIFVCGSGSNAIAACRLLADMLKSSSLHRTMRFRIFALSDELPQVGAPADELHLDRVIVDQLRTAASPGDVVMGISASGSSPAVLRAIEYANDNGCRTVCVSGGKGGKLANLAEISILVPASQLGNVEDAQIIVCRMIGHYFIDLDKE